MGLARGVGEDLAKTAREGIPGRASGIRENCRDQLESEGEAFLTGFHRRRTPDGAARLFHGAARGKLWRIASPAPKNGKGPVGPPLLVGVVQVAVAIALIRVAHWLVPLPGHWDLIVWIVVGVPLAASIHRFNKARYGAATRPLPWQSGRR